MVSAAGSYFWDTGDWELPPVVTLMEDGGGRLFRYRAATRPQKRVRPRVPICSAPDNRQTAIQIAL